MPRAVAGEVRLAVLVAAAPVVAAAMPGLPRRRACRE
jgi:hypothetical protein